ncbi:17628_t:CDS:2, partial [Cetraspora pellucida]
GLTLPKELPSPSHFMTSKIDANLPSEEFFSSFPHGTCSLSVSRLYLALGEIYHPFRAAFPNNSTLRKRINNIPVVGRFKICALPASLAVTRGILVSFFSSAY